MSILFIGIPAMLLGGMVDGVAAYREIRKRRMMTFRKRSARVFE